LPCGQKLAELDFALDVACGGSLPLFQKPSLAFPLVNLVAASIRMPNNVDQPDGEVVYLLNYVVTI